MRPRTGEVNSGIITLVTTPDHIMCCALTVYTITAPTRLPINACDELLGMPRHHVNRFQIIAL